MFPADTQFTDWLRWFCESDPEAVVTRPFPMPDGRRCASDGRWAVVTSAGPVNELPEKCKARPGKIAGLLAKTVITSREFPVEEIRGMFGTCSHPAMSVCSQCKGRGTVAHFCDCNLCTEDYEDCEDCDGKGNAIETPERQVVTLWGHAVNPNRMAYILEHAPYAVRYTLEVIDIDSQDIATFRLHGHGAEWVAILCGMKASKNESRPELIPEAQPVPAQ